LSTDEQVLKDARLANSGPALVGFFRARTQRSADADKLKELIGQLADKDKRQAAFAGLVQAGMPAVPLLRQAANNVDVAEVAAQARDCLKLIEGEKAAGLSAAAARQLAQHNPEGAVEVLLGYLPFAEDKKVAQEVEAALVAVAAPKGKLHPKLTEALKDEAAARRAVAADVICQVGTPEQRKAVKPLLKDPKPAVRLRAALGLARRHEVEAITVMIDLLGELPGEHRSRCEEFLTELAGDWAVSAPQGESPFNRRLRREVWKAWWKATEGPVLLDEFRRRTLSNDQRDKVLGLIANLGKATAKERDEAVTAVVALGPKTLPVLRKALSAATGNSADALRRCVELLERDDPGPLPNAAARLLALRKPEGAAGVLLAYVPYADSDEMAEAIQDALPDLALLDGKPDPDVLKALADPVAERRMAAAEALAPYAEQYEAVRKLFKDKDAEVRLRAALALANGGDKEAVPELIALLSEAPADRVWQAEDYLVRLAGDKKPDVSLGSNDESRKKARDAWATWWKDNGAKVAMLRREAAQRLLGYTLVLEQSKGRVLELDAAGKVRWEFGGVNCWPMDARMIGGDRVLIAEQNFHRVTERDLKGNIKWTKAGVSQPINCERLRNGNTFIATRNQLYEVDKDGKEVVHINRNQNYMMAAGRLRNGTYAFVDNQHNCYVLDRTGKELKTFRIPIDPGGGNFYYNILPTGGVLLGQYNMNKVIEVDKDGKKVLEAKVTWPATCTKMPNGHILVACMNNQKIVELDRGGKTVREISNTNIQPFRAERR
jgi:HEAT repeat protein